MSICSPVRTFSDERSLGAFHSLGVLPRRRRDKSPVFHIGHDDNDDHSSSPDEHPTKPPSPEPANVRFPRSGSVSLLPRTSRPSSPRPQLPRGASTSILLSNGKPLKSSLKSSSSSPAMLIPPQAQQMHLRARSEPSTPKNVHFPEKDYGLATVRVYNRSARPAALSNPAIGNGDETETEGEDAPTRFPFPPLSPAVNYEIDPIKSSPVPCKHSPGINLLLESLHLSPSSFSSTKPASKPLLTGSILVCNVAFEKHVVVRFTLDDWLTVSEVGAHYVDSPARLPDQIISVLSPSSSQDASPERGRGWDRFTFMIRLEDYAHSLGSRTLWLAARYRVSSTYPDSGSSQYGPGGEWWDNNGGGNYRVSFRPSVAAPVFSRSRPRSETVSGTVISPLYAIQEILISRMTALLSLPRRQPQPVMSNKEHALGLMIPTVSSNKEDKHLTPLHIGKLNLCNYAPPTVRAASSISLPPAGSPQTSSSSITKPAGPPSAAHSSSSDEDTVTPASSTLSTPSASPTITPRVIIGGHPATSTGEQEDDDRPGYIANWSWSAPSKPRIEGSSRQHVDLVPGSEPAKQQHDIPSLLEEKALHRSHSLYDTFVTQWCFAQGPLPSHHDGGGIMT